MRILLTGKNGQVGWELERTLAPLGEVVALDRDGMDLADADSVCRVIREVRPKLIVNAGAYTAVDKAESEPELAMKINGVAPEIMAEEAKKLRACVVHYSTDYVFDGTKLAPYDEDDRTNPISVYGKSKLAGEQAIRGSGCRHLIFRTSWVYGARGRNFLLTMLRLARERDGLRIVDDQIGAPTWSRLIAVATALVLAKLLAPPRDWRKERTLRFSPEQDWGEGRKLPLPPGEGWGEGLSGTFHLTTEGETSWYGFAQEIFRLAAGRQLSRPPRLEPISATEYALAADRPLNSRLSNERLVDTFGVALPAWDRSLALCMDEMR
ncbi:MAG: dTDP-4-dehydrorhamnose reductase [Gammaproteobacteria bacterium]